MLALQNGHSGFDQLRGYPMWEYLQTGRQQGTIFNEAMRDLAASMTPAVTASYGWSEFPVIADIGGGIGSQLLNILEARRPAEDSVRPAAGDLDVDLAVDSLTHPERYPLISQAPPNKRAQPTKSRRPTATKRRPRTRLRG